MFERFSRSWRLVKASAGVLSQDKELLVFPLVSTIAMVLRAIEERAGFIGRIVVGFLGTAWTVATFLAVPVLVNEDVGPIEAVQKSVTLLKKTWGENLIGNAGLGVVFGLLMVLVV